MRGGDPSADEYPSADALLQQQQQQLQQLQQLQQRLKSADALLVCSLRGQINHQLDAWSVTSSKEAAGGFFRGFFWDSFGILFLSLLNGLLFF